MSGAGLVLREATSADLAAILAMLADDPLSAGREDGAAGAGNPEIARAFAAIKRDPNTLLMVATQEGQPVATAQLSILPGLSRRGLTRGLIEAVRVRSDRRGAGLGRWLIREIVAVARARGCRVVQLTTDKRRVDAHRFYASLGFARSHEGFKLDLG